MSPHKLLPWSLLLLAQQLACASSMSTLHTGRTTTKGSIEITAGAGANLASSYLGSVVDNGKTAANKAIAAVESGAPPSLSEDETRDLMRSAFAHALFAPMPLGEIGLSYGVLERWDVGLTYASSGLRIESYLGLLRAPPGGGAPLDLAVGLQLSRQTFELPLPDQVKEVFALEDLSRTDLAVPLIASVQLGEIGFLYGGAKFVYVFLSADILEKLSSVSGRTIHAGDGLWAVGGVLGLGLGYSAVFAVLELNVLRYDYQPTLLDVEVDLSGVDVYPILGLKLQL